MQNTLSNMGIKGRFRQVAVFIALILIVALISKVIEMRSDGKSVTSVEAN